MTAYILTWNPKRTEWKSFNDDLVKCCNASIRRRWSTGNTKNVSSGKQFFFLLQGLDSGIIGSGKTVSKGFQREHWDEAIEELANYVKVEIETLLPISDRLPIETLLREVPERNWKNFPASGTTIPPDVAKSLDHHWRLHLKGIARKPTPMAEEVAYPSKYWEGAVARVAVNKFERHAKARLDCIRYHGYKCQVCEIDFGQVYGEIGLGFIHVHHRRELASIGASYQVDPVKDLIPICPNCHAMLHRKTPAMSIEELRKVCGKRKSYIRSSK